MATGTKRKRVGAAHEDRKHAWQLDSCGYKYQGAMQTNNHSEFEALREGMVVAWTRTNNEQTHLHIYGDSNIIIKHMTGRADITAARLATSAARAKELSRAFGWVTWTHVRREKNKMAEYLANVAMDGKGNHTMTANESGPDQTRWANVEQLMSNDTDGGGGGWEPSTLLLVSVGTSKLTQ